AASHISVRVAHAVLGGAAGVVWLVLPVMTINAEVPVAATRAGPVAQQDTASAQAADGTSAADLVLPLVAVAGVGILAGYGYVRRTRRARTRTTPGVAAPVAPPTGPPVVPPVVSSRPPVTPLPLLERQAGAALVQADDCVRTSRAELAFAEARFGSAAVEPFHRTLREAERELAAAFAIHLRYGRGVPEGGEEEAARRQALAGIVGRCAEAGRRLDAAAPGFDRLRALEREMGGALEVAEARFRELTGRTGAVEAVLADLHTRYPASATDAVTGYVEQAKDRLVFATTHLNQARQAADLERTGQAVRELRAAEGAVGQADTLLTGVDQLADSLAAAADLLPAALTGAEAAGARRTGPANDIDATLAGVREELTDGRPYDPLAALRSIVRAVSPLGAGQDGVLGAAAWLVGRSDVARRPASWRRTGARSAPGHELSWRKRNDSSTPTPPRPTNPRWRQGSRPSRTSVCTATRTPAPPSTRPEPSSAESFSARTRTAAHHPPSAARTPESAGNPIPGDSGNPTRGRSASDSVRTD
ncbi:hypothetical protein, partial [Streptomyces sp. MBT53]|uniref:hypothetical protein n=1 Tax=Streptomyces sp. MBT53 TaxID=1488384 RepID=UPI0027DAA61F